MKSYPKPAGRTERAELMGVVTSHLPVEWWVIVCHGEIHRCPGDFQHILIAGGALEAPPAIPLLIHGQSLHTWEQREAL